MNKIVLIGFRATGKTSIGASLAQKLNWKFLDLDEEIQKRTQKSIREIVEEEGWETFRSLERKLLEEIKNLENIVIALGGGSVLHQKEMSDLKQRSLVIWLWASKEIILERMKGDSKTLSQRPSLTNFQTLEEEIEKLLKEREKLYNNFSHVKIDTSEKNISEIVEEILANFLKLGGGINE
ncbi:MAG: shikimate kinase [Thermodesulfobacteriaceae bacterium]|nr:shikimate kinase [Thermodesulfobacteriaceae bacterium]MCX8041070.1 shikimate kinase [Thermodesulfobacteriaceae bacterium]MDW8135511.1 shikimate kinase [Thermodesulfobacterium sp.]